MSGRTRRRAAVVAAALLAALALQLLDVRLAASQSATLSARLAQDVSTSDPWDAVWERSSSLDLALSAQLVVAPRGGTREALRARALHDGRRLFVLLEWRDATEDARIDGVTAYSDAAALQFPAASTAETPPLCMGSPTAIVNIWQWKAVWQTDAQQDLARIVTSKPRAWADLYPYAGEPVFAPARALGNLVARPDRVSPVEDLHAGQYGTLTTAKDQPVGGIGAWRAGTWRVLFWRDLASGQDGDASFGVGGAGVDAAAALWDGSAAERDGLKSVSQFFVIRPVTLPATAELPFWTAALIVLVPMAIFVGGMTWLARSGWTPGRA